MPHEATDLNLRRVFSHVQLGQEISSGGILVFLDLEKALYGGSTGYIWVWPNFSEVG